MYIFYCSAYAYVEKKMGLHIIIYNHKSSFTFQPRSLFELGNEILQEKQRNFRVAPYWFVGWPHRRVSHLGLKKLGPHTMKHTIQRQCSQNFRLKKGKIWGWPQKAPIWHFSANFENTVKRMQTNSWGEKSIFNLYIFFLIFEMKMCHSSEIWDVRSN